MNFKQQLLLLMVSYRCRSRCRYCLILGAILHFDIVVAVLLLMPLLPLSLLLSANAHTQLHHIVAVVLYLNIAQEFIYQVLYRMFGFFDIRVSVCARASVGAQ